MRGGATPAAEPGHSDSLRALVANVPLLDVERVELHPNVKLELAGLAAPVLGIFAERDTFVPPAAARALEAELRAAGKRADFTIFPGVDHAFLNDTRPDVYDAASAERAWSLITSFLRAGLTA